MIKRLCVSTCLAVSFFGCVNGDSTPLDGGTDATTDAPVEADAALPTGAKLTLAASSVWVAQNGQAQMSFTIARNGVTGALTVHAAALPTGATAADATVPDGQSNGTLTIVGGSAVPGATANASITLVDETQLEDTQPLTVRISGAPGTLDSTWGQNGVYSLALTNPTVGYTLAIYPASAGANAGKIVIAGVENNSLSDVRLLIVRLLPNGQLDTTFGDLVGDGGTTRAGYTVYNPGASDDTQIETYPPAVRIDSKGRILLYNWRFIANVAPFCDVELGRWTVDGDVDTTFTRFSGGINGAYCGSPADMRVLPNDDVAVLAQWNFDAGEESVVQTFSGVDGSRQGSGYHISLDPSCMPCTPTNGACACQKSTELNRMQIDATGGYVLSGRQCDGGWNSSFSNCRAVVARVASGGGVDKTFGSSSGYTSFTFGTGTSQLFTGDTIDPMTSDVITVGRNGDGTLATMARVSGAGLPTSFGTGGSLTRDLLGGASSEGLFSPLVDSAGRIVAAGSASATQAFIANLRAAANGTLDATYGNNGINASTPGAGEEAALGNDDRLYVVGYAGSRLTVWRFWP